ncbi:GNAT family protein [Actinoplanes sp. NPDC049548]|uniref:GNAT family N-acetyltransferase n=1 Tax=Actinoplanes sp. NPDC049548 TaxID=3155152 RepID=UPI0034358B8E
MIADHWPLFGLRLRTPRLELRLPDLDDLARLGDVAAAGVHDPAVMPFVVTWTDTTPQERARNTIKWQWTQWGSWSPQRWTLQLVVVADGEIIGTQDIGAADFATSRVVGTGSWLGLAYQGRGYGTEMRAAVLDLAFTGLGAEYATSEAFEDNAASYAVSRKLGYADNGIEWHVVRGERIRGRRLVLDRDAWAAARTTEVEITGLEPCLPLFGLGPDTP